MEETNKLYYGPMPRVLNEDILSFLEIKHKDEIGIGAYFGNCCPRIRYVIDKDRFGYADFGDFFFLEDGGRMFGNRVKNLKKTTILTL